MNLYDYIVGESPKAKTSSNATDFANQYGSIADQVGQKLGVSPDLILSQLALETGYGKSVIPGTNNLGNIKDFSGGGVAATDNMTGSRDKYRQYDTPEDFANDYADLLSRKYKGIVGAGDNADKFIAGLRGYAEDPNYGNKIKSVLANIKGTPRIASEAPQAAPVAQSRPGYMSDDPFDPFSTNPIQYGAKPESQGFATRAAESFGKGSGQLIKGLGWLVQSDTVQGLGDRATQYWSQKLEQDPETMKQLKAVTDAKGFWDSAKEVVTNPRALSDFIFSSLPAQAVGMGAGALTSRAVNSLAYNMAIKAGATESVAFEAAQLAAAKAAQSAAVKAGSATNMAAEGVTQGAMSGAETEEYLVSQGMSREEAHAEALKTAAKVGISTAALSGLTAGMETRAAMGVGNKSGIKAVAGSTGKGALEEGAQNVSQEYFETGAKQQVTPGYEADYGKAFATGALTGGVMSGGTHALGNIAARPEPIIPTVEALNQQSSEIAKAKIDDIGKATTVDQAVQSFTEAATQPLQVDTTPLDTARQVVQQMESERVNAPVAPVGEQVGEKSPTTPLTDDSLNSRAPISEKISQPELPQATPQEKESQVKSAIATPAMREMMGKLPAEQRAEVLNLSNQSVSGSLESRAPAIERLHQIMSDNGALTTTGEPITQPKQNIQQLKEQVKSIVSTPEWTAHLQTLSPSERTFANEVVSSVNNPKLPAGYRSMLAEVVNDYNAQLPKQAKANEPAAMIADNNFEPEIGKLAYVAPDTLPKVGDGLTQDKAMSIQKLGKVFGKEVHFFNQEGSQTRLDGYADPKYKDAIFVNANKGDAAWHYVAGHEFFHQLDPKIKKSFIEAVAPLVPADRLGKLKEYINQGKLDEAGQWEEIGADLFGNRFGEADFLGKALSNVKDTSTLMKMVSAIRDFVAKVLASAKEQGFTTDRFVSDLNKVRAAAEEALKQHLNQEKTKDVSEPAKTKEETTQAKTAEDTQSAIKILEQAGITGKERLDAIKDVKAGTVSIQELESAYPAKIESKEDIAERNRIAAEKDKAFTDYATPKEDELDSIVEAGRDAKVREAEGLTQLQGFDEDVKTAIEEKMQDAVNNILSIPVSKRSSLQKKLLKKFSIQENQKPAPKPAKKGSGVQSLRDSLKRKNPFLAFLAENGINTADRSDVGGQDSKRYFASGYGAIFRKKGLRLDELAQLAEERGFLTQADVANESDNGGVNKLADMINQAINGEVVTTGEQDFDFQSYYDDQLKNTALEFGIDIRGKSLDRLADLVNMHYASMDESTIAAREAEFESQLQEINNDALAKLQQYSIENLLENDEQFTQRSTQNNDEPSSEVTPKNYQQRNFKKENFNQREVERILDIPEENRSNKQTEFLNRNAKLSSERKEIRDLVLTHNLTEENLLHADKMGGIAVPSLAVTKADSALTGFGEITLIGDKNMADPKGYAKTKVYGADIYSPRYPNVDYKVAGAPLKKINSELAAFNEKFGTREIYANDLSRDALRDLADMNSVKAAALAEKGIEVEPVMNNGKVDDWKTKMALRTAIQENDLYGIDEKYAKKLLEKSGAEERIFKGYSPSGNRQYMPHTLENVVKMLKKELRGGEGFNYGAGSLRAKFTPEFKSVKDIQANKGRLVSTEEFTKVKDEINNELVSVGNAMNIDRMDTVIAILEDAPKMGLDRAAKQYDKVLSEDAKVQASEFLTKLKNLPTEYFEAKILRDVDLSEFSGAVVPKDISEKALSILKRNGIPVKEYASDDERVHAIHEFAVQRDEEKGNVLFSSQRKEITNTPEFQKWFGDSKVVDADGNPMVVYHGNADDFAEFKDVGWSKKDQGWLGRGFYFTTSKNTASSYANLKSGMADPNVMPVYLSLKNPFVATMRDKESGMFAEKRGDKEMPFKKRDGLIEKGHDGVVLHYRGDDGEIRESEYVVFNSNQIKSAIGNNGEFDASNPDIRMSVARNSIPLYQENKSIPDTLKEVAKDPQLAVDAAKGLLTSGKPQSELVETIVTNLFDSTNTMEQIARRTGKNEAADKFLTTQKLYKAASQKVVNDAVKEYADPMLEKLQTEWKDKYSKMAWYKETGYKQFLNDIGTIGNLVKHGPERNADIARKTEGKDQAGSGRTNEEIAQIEKDIRREAPGLIELYEDIYANNLKPMIDIGNNAKRESGLITPEMEAARQNYEWYVPLYGDPSEFDNTNVGSGGGGLKSIKDKNAMGRSGTLADNVMQNVLKQMSSAVQQAGSQELKSALVDWVKSSPAAKLAMGAKINDAGTREIFEKYTGPDGLVHERVKPGAAISPTAMVYKNGNETTVIDFKNAKVIESLNGNKQIEGILGGVQKATRLMGAVFTRYNPIFPVMNKLRDSQSQISFVMADAPVQNKFKAAQDTLANNIKYSTQWGKNESPEYKQWKDKFEKLGGATMYADILSDDVMKNIEREFAVQVDNKLLANKLGNRLGKVIDAVNEHMEMSSRVALFKALVDNGMTERAAALYSKNTMNFEAKGKWGQQLGAIYTFAGPALFDARRMAQSLRTPRGALVMAAQFGMMFGLYGALKSLAGDDEDGVNRLNKIPVNQSGRFLTFVSEDGTGYKIPVGFGYSRIALTLAASLHRYMDGVDDIGQFAQNVAIDGLISNFSVIEPKDISIKKDAMGWAMQTFLPTITQPMYQVAANQNFQGAPIHKPDEWTGSKLHFQQAWPNTPELFREAAKSIYDTTGIDVYPETLSHLTRSYGGNGVMDVVRAFQLAGEKADKDWALSDIPAAQGFASRASSQDANKFREKFEEAQKLESERKYAMKEGNLADFDAEHPDMIRDLSIYKSANKVIKELYTQRKAVAGTDDAKAINERIRSIQMRANKEAASN